MTLLKAKLNSRKRVLFCALACACLFISCRKGEKFTDVYYIHNDLDQSVSFLFAHPMVWDTCATDSFVRVWYNSERAEIQAHKTIRLHPIDRDYTYPSAHAIEPGSLLGETTKMVVGADTIVWFSKYSRMFTDDSVWSVYNTLDWKTVKDQRQPNTYYSTFTITEQSVERSLKQ